MKELQLAVKGMHCAACSSRIESVVGGMDGVEKASVNLAAETMALRWDEGAQSFEEIAERVSGMGLALNPSVHIRIFLKKTELKRWHAWQL